VAAWGLSRAREEGLPRGILPVAKAGGKASEGKGKEKGSEEKPKISARELRYKAFASYVYKGEPYMSARDFLESLIRDEPRSVDKEVIDDKIVDRIVRSTPARRKGSDHLFKDMWNESLLSYGDYLFLLTALVKTRRQFEIAFKMYDVDDSDFIDQEEFSRVEKSVTAQRDNAIIEQKTLPRSSLSVHLFGYKGKDKLYSGDFIKFVEDLQSEVRRMEFDKYSSGSPTMAEEDFARILLKHTTWDLEPVFQRLRARSPSRGISFQQYDNFCELLNSLEDFSIAMTMYTIAGHPVSEEEFGRAAHICLGKPLDSNLVSTIFEIFDIDGDHKLSYREFIAVMRGWKLRGYKMREKKQLGGAWEEFKACVKMEMKNK
jgi:Ca2+-binding EF-hand superfamily protein